MYQRDFILRIIEQLGRALVQLRRRMLAEKLPAQELQGELEAVARQAGLNLELIRSVDSATLPMLVAPSGEMEPARCWLAAELLYLEILRAHEAGRTHERLRELDRALELCAYLPDDWSPPPELPSVAERETELLRWRAEAVSGR